MGGPEAVDAYCSGISWLMLFCEIYVATIVGFCRLKVKLQQKFIRRFHAVPEMEIAQVATHVITVGHVGSKH